MLSTWRMYCPRPRRREPGRCVPVVAFPLIATYSALPTVGGAKSAVPGNKHGSFDYMHSMPYTKSRGRGARPPIHYPGGNRPEGYGQTVFFAEYRPDWDRLKRSFRRPQRWESGP
jgi:hypothetical protein